jgi:GNAT superfamily N-acetyltransferase
MTGQDDFTIVLATDASVEVRNLILQNIHQANVAALGPMDMQMLRLVIQGADGKPLGGMWGRTSFRWLFIELLAVPDSLRGRGLGTEMLRRAEAEARDRGCIGAWLDTFTADSRRLYERCGFRTFGEIPDYPPGNTRAFLMKRWA